MKNTHAAEFSLPHLVIITGAGIGTWLESAFLQELAMVYLGLYTALALIVLLTPIRYIHPYLNQMENHGDRSDWNILTIVILTMLGWYIATTIMVFVSLASLVVKKQWQKYKQPTLKKDWLEDSLSHPDANKAPSRGN